MGEQLAKHMRSRREKEREKKRDSLAPGEEVALEKLKAEAEEAGAILTSDGEGGLPPSLVLGVMRRDKFTCKVHGDKGEDDYGGLQVHHKGGIVESKWLSKKGHANEPNNIVTICAKGHDEIHNKAREDGVDSGQVTPSGDKGDKRRDKGLPDAEVDK